MINLRREEAYSTPTKDTFWWYRTDFVFINPATKVIEMKEVIPMAILFTDLVIAFDYLGQPSPLERVGDAKYMMTRGWCITQTLFIEDLNEEIKVTVRLRDATRKDEDDS